MTTPQAVLDAFLLAMAIVWLAMVVWVFRRLRTSHLATFEVIGSPHLIWNNTPRTNWLFLKFLYGPAWHELADRPLSLVMRVMQWMLPIYLVLFVMLFVLVG